jgi:galactonate dehydratase
MIAGVVAQVEAVRGAVGPDVEILLDLHGRPEPYAAVRLATALETVRPYFLEEPVPPGDVEALALVAERSRVPLATGERVFTTQEWLPIVARGLVEHIQPDVIQVGGLLEARKIAALAEARHLRVAPHNPRSPVGTAASLHLSAVLPDLSLLEMPADDYLWYATWRDELVRDPSALRVEDGCLRVPDAPGLGVELDHQAVARHRSRGGVATV